MSIQKVQGDMRARDVRAALKGKVDPDLLLTLEALAEVQFQHTKEMSVMASAISQMADIIAQFATVSENMKSTIVEMRGQRDAAPSDHPVSTER